MFKRSFYTCFGVIIGVFCVLQSWAQTAPVSDYTQLPGVNNAPVSDSDVCPSFLPTYPSSNTFRITAETADAGVEASNEFEWAVYGGTITAYSGSIVIAVTTSEISTNIHFSSVRTSNVETGDSWITVVWDEVDIAEAWVAVRQSSEWGCTDSAWSVYTQEVVNQTPEFTADFPDDIHIPYNSRSGFVLPDPTSFSQDLSCPVGASLSYSYVIDLPGGGQLTGNTITNPTLSVDLLVGDNVVTWTVSDGVKEVEDAYTITVEPLLEILNVAWTNPYCADNGTALVTSVTNDVANPFAFLIEYSFNGGTYWRAAEDTTGLAAGDQTVRARIVYDVDIDNDGLNEQITQFSEEYTFTLHANAANSVDPGPEEVTVVTVAPTSCSSSDDGVISFNNSLMISQNNSVTFNGTGTHLLLNKSYTAGITAFAVAAWVKTSANNGVILSFDNTKFYQLGLSSGQLQLITYSSLNETNNIKILDLGLNINDGAWHQVVASYDGTTYTLYVDGTLGISLPHVGSPTIGTGTVTRYGMIGCVSANPTFTNNPGGTYFNGQIAEVAILDGVGLDQNAVTAMYTTGISSVGLSDHWVLNDVPSNVSPAFSSVFTDYGNDSNSGEWARMYSGSLSTNNAPKLYSWTDDATVIMNKMNLFTRSNLTAGASYELNVTDILGCGLVSEPPYVVPNGDEGEPVILWNVSVGKTATQSTTALAANYAVDGYYDTNAATTSEPEPWLTVDLTRSYSVRKVKVTSNGAVSNVWVMVSQTPFSGATLADDIATVGVTSQLIPTIGAGATEFVLFNKQARYIRIRTDNTIALELNEVEVLTDHQPAVIRNLYLSDDCSYLISTNDASVDVEAFDVCGATTLTHNYLPTNTTLIDQDWIIGNYTVTWTATDTKGLPSTLNITYAVRDTVKPVFLADPFFDVPSSGTSCWGTTYQFPVPGATDNYVNCAGTKLRSISLIRDGSEVFVLKDADIIAYDPGNPGLVPVNSNNLRPGDHVFQWKIVDINDNITLSALYPIHVEVAPLLREVRVAPISCNDYNNAIVYFSKITSEPAAPVDYILRPIGGGADIPATAAFAPVAPGNYRALIRVNSCESNIYSEDVIITNPEVIDPNPSITDVQCYGESNGAISLTPIGGSRTNIIHFMTDGSATAGNYVALNVANSVMVECWIFLDSLAAGGLNWNADLFGVGSSYGLRMAGGQLSFYAGSASVTAGAGAIAQRVWTHIAGDYTWNSGLGTGTLNLYIDGAVAGLTALGAVPTIASGESVYFGYNGNDYLNGFVRNARIWSAMPATFGENMRLLRPIVPTGISLLASYPVNETGGTSIVNSVSGGTHGTISGTYANQKFAYYWLHPDGSFLGFTRNISGQPTGDYNVSMFDPLGCYHNDDITIDMGDDEAPTMTFYSDRERTTLLGVGVPIVRYTDDVSGGINSIGDCYYHPYTYGAFTKGEFDPVVDDGVCDKDLVSLSYTVVSSTDGWGDPAPVGGEESLDGIGMIGIITLEWTASDNKNSSTQQITYYAVDNEPPVRLNIEPYITRYTDFPGCEFTVPAGDLIPVLSDNCNVTTGRLYNNLNNSSTLDGFEFDPAESPFTIIWTYEDKEFPDEATNPSVDTTIILTVSDEQMPTAVCQPAFGVYLDDLGAVTIDYTEVDLNSSDNCGTIADYHLTRNIAYYNRVGGAAASQSSYDNTTCGGTDQVVADRAIDGNTDGAFANCSATLTQTEVTPSWWQVDLGASNTIYGISVYGNDQGTLDNFWIIVSTTATPSYSGDLTTGSPLWSADVVDSLHYTSGTLAGEFQYLLSKAATGRYVRIWMDHTGPLSLSEVEVYGAVAPASSIDMDCDDVRYTPAADTGNPGSYDDAQGSFGATGVLLTVIDDDGNLGSCLESVTVYDMEPPVVITQNVTLNLDPVTGLIDLGEYTASIDDGSYDLCEIDIMWVTSPNKTCDDIGGRNITFNVRDIHGNTSSRSQPITIADSEAPTVPTYASIVLELDDDGQYTINPELDFIDGLASDNCNSADELIYTTTPATVNCADAALGYIDLTLEVKDLQGNTRTINFLASENTVQVIDNRPPVASLENFQLIIQSDGDSMIRFQDIIPNANLFDNCDGYGQNIPVKQIKYTSGSSWCDAGNEGTDGTNAFSNIANQADNTESTSEAPYSSYVATNASDLNPLTSFISGGNTGERWIEYNFGSTLYEFERMEVIWHDDNTLITVTPISQTLSPTVNTGRVATAGTYIYNDLTYVNDGTGGDAGAYSNTFDTNQGSNGINDEIYIEYDFGSDVLMSSTMINWGGDGPSNSYDNPYVIYRVNGSGIWNTVGDFGIANNTDYSLDMGDVMARYVRVVFDRPGGDDVKISEWIINTESGYNCVLPVTAYLKELDTDGSTWIDVVGATNIGVAGTPDDNATPFTSNIETTALRLYFTGTTGYVGIKEWRVYGRLAGAASACTKYDCSVVHTNVDVWLQWEDNAGNPGSAQVQVEVLPYFDITEVQIKDCGYAGERYYPVIDDLSGLLSYSYIWDEVDDDGDADGIDGPADQGLFEDLGGTNIPNGSLPYTYTTQEWINLNTAAHGPADGTYIVNLRVEDIRGSGDPVCYDDFEYTFQYDYSSTEATSVKQWDACVGETETFAVLFPSPFTFWREDFNQVIWTVNPAHVTVTPGTGTSAVFGRTVLTEWVPLNGQNGDMSITVTFLNTTAANGTTTDIEYEYKGYQFTGTVNSAVTTKATTGPVTGWTLVIVGELEPGGPYWTENQAYNGQTINAGERYIQVSGNTWYTSDYDMCSENLVYQTTVLSVDNPVIYCDDQYDTHVMRPASEVEICPRDTFWYRIENIGIYEDVSWNLGLLTGRRLAQGNYYDDSIQIVWDQVPTLPSLTVTGYNALDCSSETTFSKAAYNDKEFPVLRGEPLAADNDCSAMDQAHVNSSDDCGYTFQNLPPPLMEDDCHDWIEDYWCEIDNTGDGLTDWSGTTNANGFYPVGTSTVTWHAVDFSNNERTCIVDITVTDTQDPRFNKIPTNVPLYANAAGVQYFTATTHDLTAWDNCGIAVGDTVAQIDMGKDGTWDYTGLLVISDPGNTRAFPMDTSKVKWTATDIYGNVAVDSFYVIVRDNTKPDIAVLANLTHDTEEGVCTYTFGSITGPVEADLSDNVTTPANLLPTVTFVSRNDGAPNLLDPYEVGTTEITWRVTDESGNYGTRIQNVIISDNEQPTFNPADANLQDRSISFCAKKGYRLPIPLPSDNCGMTNVASITYTVTGGKGALNYPNTILRANGTFNPNGTGLTDSIPNFYLYVYTYAEVNSGTDFIVTWTALDEDGNASYDDLTTYTYDLHVEIEPVFSSVTPQPTTCGGAGDGVILIGVDDNNTAAYHYDRNYTPEFSINNGNPGTYFAQETFPGLSGADYKVKMQVNGCVSTVIKNTSIDEPTAYTLNATPTNVLCPEDIDGAVSLAMGGGAAGQLHFAGTGYTAPDYDELDIITEGSVAAWVYLDNLDNGTLFSKGTAYSMTISSNNLVFTLEGSSITASSFTLLPEYWYYVVGTWDGGGMNLYINGNPEANGTGAANVNTDDMVIGNFDGILRDVCVWNTVIGSGIPGAPYNGKETGLVGLWQMNDGAGAYAYNSTRINSFGNDATGAAGLWTTTLPQPGYYAWKKNNSSFSDHINLGNLGIGEYSVLFVDPYGCPNTVLDPLADTVSVIATDNVAPVIEDLGNLIVDGDSYVCYYDVNSLAEAELLSPLITDPNGCDYHVYWKVVTDYNQNNWTKYEEYIQDESTVLEKIQGAILDKSDVNGNGLNTVTVTAVQNVVGEDSVYSTEVYTITVNDVLLPTPDGRFDEPLTIQLNENGLFNYAAENFNRSSYDNCTIPDSLFYELSPDGGTSWGTSIDFDCSHIGTEVEIWFRVTDMADLSTEQSGTLNGLFVEDVTDPEFSGDNDYQPRGPYCATNDMVGLVPAYTDNEITLSKFQLTNPTDNCGIAAISYRLDHAIYDPADTGWIPADFDDTSYMTFYEGETTVWFLLDDGNGNFKEAPIFLVTVLPKPDPGGGFGIE